MVQDQTQAPRGECVLLLPEGPMGCRGQGPWVLTGWKHRLWESQVSFTSFSWKEFPRLTTTIEQTP